MFNLDSNFLNEIGLGDMPEEEKSKFLEHLQEELEVRVGEKISEGLDEEQIGEFEKIIDGDAAAIANFLGSLGDYRSDERYQRLLENGGLNTPTTEVLSSYASIRWLEQNRPDYQQIVEKISEELKIEAAAGKDAILGMGA